MNDTETILVPFRTTPFPFHGIVSGTQNKPFLDVNQNERLRHLAMRHGILWEDETYSDRRVLLCVPKGFNPSCPLTIVVFLHGNESTLERDVRDRQAPVILVAYSGGYLPAAAAIRYGQATERIRGIVLLDALYGELDTFHEFIVKRCKNQETSFFLSVYGYSSHGENEDLKRRLIENGTSVETALSVAIQPASVTFIDIGNTVVHSDFVTHALNGNPLTTILSRLQKCLL